MTSTIDQRRQSLRICLFTTEFPPEVATGGIGAHTEAMAVGLTALGHAVHVVAPTWEREARTEECRGYRIARVPRPAASGLREPRQFAASMSAALEELDDALRFDVVDAPEYGAATAFLRPRRGRLDVVRLHTGARLVTRFRRGFPRERVIAELSHRLEQRAISAADVVTAPSSVVVVEETRRPVTVIPNAVEIAAEPAPLEQRLPLVVFAGRLEHRKRPDTVVLAARHVLGQRPDARFAFAGPDTRGGLRRESMRASCEKLVPPQLRSNVEFLGPLRREEVHRLLAAAAVLAVPSAFESFGVVYAEAMFAGAVPIGCRGTAAAEVIDDGRTGLLVDLDDVNGLARSILRVLNDEPARVRIARTAQEVAAAQFSAAAVAAAHDGMYRSRARSAPR